MPLHLEGRIALRIEIGTDHDLQHLSVEIRQILTAGGLHPEINRSQRMLLAELLAERRALAERFHFRQLVLQHGPNFRPISKLVPQ